MFLLIPKKSKENWRMNEFTFQYVSINTQATKVRLSGKLNLHSNMFLLILGSLASSAAGLLFTFQYVSINTIMTPLF